MNPSTTLIMAQYNDQPGEKKKKIKIQTIFEKQNLHFRIGKNKLPKVQSAGQKASESAPHKRCTRPCPHPNGCKNNAINTHIAVKIKRQITLVKFKFFIC